MAARARNIAKPFDHHRGAKPLLRRTRPLRTGLFLLINLAGFVVVNVFWRYLATGHWSRFGLAEYRHDAVMTLSEMLLHPLSILTHPWMILVWGLVLAVVLFVPLIVSVLYRLVFAAVFVVVIAAVGHSPVLALVVALGCVLAAYTPLRSDLPFLAVLLGMAPVAAFLLAISFVGLDEASVLPVQRWLLSMPILIALVLVAVSAAVVLSLARVTGFRPGVVWPVLAVLLAPPMTIFHLKIGADELAYAMIVNPPQKEGRLAPGDALFQPVPLNAWIDHNDIVVQSERAIWNLLEDELVRRRRALSQQCDEFLTTHGDSDRKPVVLWIKAQSASLQLDEQALDAERRLVRFSASHPLPRSRSHWRRLIDEHPGSAHAALARWRLGVLSLAEAADADEPLAVVSRADEHLSRAYEGLSSLFPEALPLQWAEPHNGLFMPHPSIPSQRYYAEALLAVERLRWLMEQNNAFNEPKAARALGEYTSLNPLKRDHTQRLKELAGKYEDTPLGDNLKLAVARHIRDPYQRAEMLIWLAEGKPTDAAIEANYLLGMIAMRTSETPELVLNPDLKDPREYFRLVLAGPPSPYHRLARDRMRWLEASKRPGL
ncbi:MAG: hypothetical protein ACLFVW_00330 [Phycisphaerae bacterium]